MSPVCLKQESVWNDHKGLRECLRLIYGIQIELEIKWTNKISGDLD